MDRESFPDTRLDERIGPWLGRRVNQAAEGPADALIAVGVLASATPIPLVTLA